MPVEVHITYIGHPEMKAKAVAGHVAVAMARVIDYWHSHTLPKHFVKGAERIYKYTRRTSKYLRNKRRRGRGDTLLVYTGALRHQVQRELRLTSLKTRAEAVGRMRGPRYLYMTPSMMYRHAYGREVAATTKKERDAMAKRIDMLATRSLNRMKDRRTVRIK